MGTSTSSVANVRNEFFDAVRRGQVGDMMTLLERYGASHHLLRVVQKDSSKSQSADTALGVAAREQHVEIVELLLEHNASPNSKGERLGDENANVHSPLHHASIVRGLY